MPRIIVAVALFVGACGPLDSSTPAAGPGPSDALETATYSGALDGGSSSVNYESRPWTERPLRPLPVDCRLVTSGSFHSVDPTRPTAWRAGFRDAFFASEDEGRTWDRLPFTGSLGFVPAGPVLFAVGGFEPYDVRAQDLRHAVSADRGRTWSRPRFKPTRDASHPTGTVVVDLGGNVHLAWTPTRLLKYSIDGGRSWASEPDAYAPGADDFEWRSAIGSREWLGSTSERAAWKTSDGGRTWQRVTLPQRLRDAALMGSRGVVAVLTGEEGSPALWVSQDDGETWTVRDGFGRGFGVGPAEGEIWAPTFARTGQVARLMHSLDWGASFEEVRFVAGSAGAVGVEGFAKRLFQTPDGRIAGVRAFHAESVGPLNCVGSTGAGEMERPMPSLSTQPGTATFWGTVGPVGFLRTMVGRQDWLPLRAPGKVFDLTRFAQPPGQVTHSINGLARTADGQVALLVQPLETVIPNSRFPMEVRRYDPETGAPGVFERFDNTTDDRGNTLHLASQWLHASPDGPFLTDTALGVIRIGGDVIRLSAAGTGLPIDARWGRYMRPQSQQHLAAVTVGNDGIRHVFALVRNANEAAERCLGPLVPGERCLAYQGRVRDWGMREGRLFVLDDWRGTLWEASFDSPEVPFRAVLTGLQDPSRLYVPTDDDPGLYVFDSYVYRVVPGSVSSSVPPRRP